VNFLELIISLIVVSILSGPISMFVYQSTQDSKVTREINKANNESEEIIKDIRDNKIKESYKTDDNEFFTDVNFIENTDKIAITLRSKRSNKEYKFYSYILGEDADWVSK
jgi:type II secretory pathway pseudopilin PulG